MATIMSKQGNVDNVVTYEHYCDTVADLDNIPYNESTLGSVAVVLVGESGGLEIYIANSNHEWIPLVSGGGGGNVTVEELNITENGTYTAPSGKAYSPVNVEVSDDLATSIVDRTISTYTNNTISFIGWYAFADCKELRTVNLAQCTEISGLAFYSCVGLTNVYAPNCTKIGQAAFRYDSNLTTIIAPECISIEENAFHNCQLLSDINFSKCTQIGSSAFAWCNNLSTCNFPECSMIGRATFSSCSNIIYANLPLIDRIPEAAFLDCINLEQINAPLCTSVSWNGFKGCSKLTNINFSLCSILESGAFENCTNLAIVSLPICSSIEQWAFHNCSTLSILSLPKAAYIRSAAFSGCQQLLSVYLLGSSIPLLAQSNAFSSTPIAGYTSYTSGVLGSIYVRASMLSLFQSATNWVYFSNRMVGLTDEQIAALS